MGKDGPMESEYIGSTVAARDWFENQNPCSSLFAGASRQKTRSQHGQEDLLV